MSYQPPPLPSLVMRRGPHLDRLFYLNKNVVTVGRDQDNDIIVEDAEVSRHHARLTLQGNNWVLEDLGSRNGTFVNGQRLTGPLWLGPGSQIAAGPNVLFSLETGPLVQAAAVPSPAPPLVTRGRPPWFMLTVLGLAVLLILGIAGALAFVYLSKTEQQTLAVIPSAPAQTWVAPTQSPSPTSATAPTPTQIASLPAATSLVPGLTPPIPVEPPPVEASDSPQAWFRPPVQEPTDTPVSSPTDTPRPIVIDRPTDEAGTAPDPTPTSIETPLVQALLLLETTTPTPTPAAQYDLYVRRMDYTPPNPVVGDAIKMAIMLATDTAPRGAPYFPASHYRWRQGPAFPWQEQTCPASTQYASCLQSVTFSYSQPGSYVFEVQADNRNEVPEANEANNARTWTIQVGGIWPTISTIQFRADAPYVNAGACTTLRWDVEGVREVYLDGAPVTGHGSKQVCLCQATTYTLHVVKTNGSAEDPQVRVDVYGSCGTPPPPPSDITVDFRADPPYINAGSCTTLRWDVEGVRAVYLNRNGVTGHSSQQVCPCQATTYTLQIIKPDNSSQDFPLRVDVYGSCQAEGPLESLPPPVAPFQPQPLPGPFVPLQPFVPMQPLQPIDTPASSETVM